MSVKKALLIILLLLSIPLSLHKGRGITIVEPRPIAENVVTIKAEVFTEELLLKQRMVESNDNQLAVSRVGARGVAQFMPSTWNWMKDVKMLPKRFDINNRKHQVKAQKIYLNYLYNAKWDNRVDKLRAVLASYNCGRGRVLKTIAKHGTKWEQHLPLETRNYLKKIMDA